MATVNLDDVESIRVLRVAGNLRLRGTAATSPAISCSRPPELRRDGATLEVTLSSNGEIEIPSGVAIDVVRCSGNLEAGDVPAPLHVGRIRGNLRAWNVGALAIGEGVDGNLEVASARAVECADVRGNAHFYDVEGAVRPRTVDGNLDVRRVGSVEAGNVAGRARLSKVGKAVKIASVRGKLKADGVGGDLVVNEVGRHAIISDVQGSLDLPDVGGVAELGGPMPAGKTWRVQSRGRISVELDDASAAAVLADAGSCRVRLYGVEGGGLKWSGSNQVEGALGAERLDVERTRLVLKTTDADIIIAAAGARPRDYSWREHRFGRRFAAPFEDLASELGDEIPDLVSAILGATGKFVSQTGAISGGFVRGFASGVGESLADVYRMLGELGETVPRDVAEELAEQCRRISRLIRHAARQRRTCSPEARREAEERIREAAREMRETIREAARKIREEAAGKRAGDSDTSPAETAAPPAYTQPLTPEARERDVLAILKAVKAGEIEPDEADDMIAALIEVEQAGDES
ncbi:MAG TPA: hypothetical protein VEC38_06250 [Candidatus Binataceae bacterium]|nr:hypothetical protein [Candidatus Binataceae bacterium]